MNNKTLLKFFKRCKIRKGIVFLSFILCFLLSAFNVNALDNPHNVNNSISCGNCHMTTLVGGTIPGWWTNQGEEAGVCGQCHNPTGVGSDVKGHSSANTSETYGMWNTKCTDCHNPHYQRQNRVFKSASYLYTGASTGVTTSTLTTTVAGANWTTNQWAGMILIPNVAYQALNYRILSNTAAAVGAPGTLTIDTGAGGVDVINLKYIKLGQTFGIVYGKLVKDIVNVKWVRFFRQIGANSFADGNLTVPPNGIPDGICEVCHTQTRMANTTNVVPRWRSTGNSDDHYAGQSCKGCHDHVEGFKATCTSCHGNPPVNTTTLVNPTTGSVTAGAHNMHANTKNIACGSCHLSSVGGGSTHNSVPHKVTIGFSLFSGAHLGGIYNGQTGVSYDASEINTTYTNDNTKTCNNIYCHSTGQSLTVANDPTPAYATPAWDGTAACGTCHGASKAEVSNANSGSHADHVNNAGVSGCNACHTNANAAGTQYNATTHVDNLIDVEAGVSYTLAGARGNGYGTCTTTCHSATTAAGTTPTWGAAGNCATCHPLEPATGSHTNHIAASATCGNCHNGAVEGSNAGTAHLDTDIDVTNGYPANVAKHASGSYTGTCSTASCHANPYVVGGYITTPTWGSTGNGCAACHTGANVITANGPATGSHALHNETDCTKCHNAGTAATTKPNTEHADGLIDTANVTYTDEKAKNSPFTTCSTASCHGSGSPTWGANTANNMCTKCHGTGTVSVTPGNRYVVAPPVNTARNGGTATGLGQVDTTALSKIGAHQTHLRYLNGLRSTANDTNDNDDRCQWCHGTLPVAGTHADTTSVPTFTGSTIANHNTGMSPNYTSPTCTNTYCHNPAGSGGSLAGANAGTDPAPSWTNAAYIADGTLKTTANCNVCHKSPGTNPGDILVTSTTNHSTFTIATDCSGCHGHNGGTTGIVGQRHIDGIKYGGGNCDSCHGYQESSWSGATERATEGKGAHAKHVKHLVTLWGSSLDPATNLFGSGASWTNVCQVCHNGATHTTSEPIGGTDRTISIGVSHQFGGSVPAYSGVIGNSSSVNLKSCSNVDCHFKKTPAWSAY